MEQFDAVWTQAVLDEVCRRSRDGEGVAAVLTSMGLDAGVGLDWLQKFHMGHVVAAKRIQIEKKRIAQVEREEKAAKEARGSD